nr:DUF2235 domain-containing protein [Bradyrhizobium sp. BRP56]
MYRAALARYFEHPDWLQQVWFAGNHFDVGGSIRKTKPTSSTSRWVGWRMRPRTFPTAGRCHGSSPRQEPEVSPPFLNPSRRSQSASYSDGGVAVFSPQKGSAETAGLSARNADIPPMLRAKAGPASSTGNTTRVPHNFVPGGRGRRPASISLARSNLTERRKARCMHLRDRVLWKIACVSTKSSRRHDRRRGEAATHGVTDCQPDMPAVRCPYREEWVLRRRGG